MSATAPASSGRWLRLALGGLVLAAGIALAVHFLVREPPADDGLVVHVRVEDPTGTAIPDAQVSRRYAPGWQDVDAEGRLRLVRVVLRVEEVPTPAALQRALEVRSPYHALRAGHVPEVERDDTGTWHARFVVEPFGLLRVHVHPTNLPAVKAWVESPGHGVMEAVGGLEHARVGQSAEWRIYEDRGPLQVRIEGATGVAARRRTVDSPALGFVRELTMEAEKARPIRGRVLPPTDHAPPTLGGRLDVQEIAEDGTAIPHYSVAVRDDGGFKIPYAGEGRYRLHPKLAYLDAEPRTVRGGSEVEVADAHARSWVRVAIEPPPPDGRAPTIRLLRLPKEAEVTRAHDATHLHDRWCVPLPGPGRYLVSVALTGTKTELPARGATEIEVEARPGPYDVAVALADAPSGTVRVEVERPPGSGGAQVLLLEGGRRQTVLFDLRPDVAFPNVRAGLVEVYVEWKAPWIAAWFGSATLENGAELTLQASARQGGKLVVRGAPAPPTASDVLTLRLEPGSPYGDGTTHIVLAREGDAPRWKPSVPLLPGAYRGTIDEGPPVTFEIVEQETTEIEVSFFEGNR